MLCDVCKCNDATVFLTQILEGKMQKVNLCDACSKEKGVQDPTGFAAPMPSSKSASAKPVGSWTPFSFEQASQRFTFCILPSRICVRKTVASLHLQTSHNIFVRLDLESQETFNRGHLRAP